MATAHSGWIVAFLVGTWGVVLRALIGRHLAVGERIQLRLAKIEERLAVIESRSHDRRREDPHRYEEDPT